MMSNKCKLFGVDVVSGPQKNRIMVPSTGEY